MKNTFFKSNIFKFLILAVSFFAGSAACAATDGNIIAFSATTYLTSFAIQELSGVALMGPNASLFCTIAHVKKGPCGVGNPGGGHKLWLAPADQFTAPWGHTATAGTITVAPTMAVGFVGWIEVEVSDNSLKLDQMLKGRPGYQSWESGFEVKVAGDTPAQTAALEKFINTELVGVIELNDLQRKTIGSSIFPLTFEANHTTGDKGSSERGWTLKAKQDGLSNPAYFVGSAVALNIAPSA